MSTRPKDVTGGSAKGDGAPGRRTVTLRFPYSTEHDPFDGSGTALTRTYLSALDIWLPEATAAVPIGAGAGAGTWFP